MLEGVTKCHCTHVGSGDSHLGSLMSAWPGCDLLGIQLVPAGAEKFDVWVIHESAAGVPRWRLGERERSPDAAVDRRNAPALAVQDADAAVLLRNSTAVSMMLRAPGGRTMDQPIPRFVCAWVLASRKDGSLADQGDAGRGVGSGHGDGPAVSASAVCSRITRGAGLRPAEMLLASSAPAVLTAGSRKPSSFWISGAASCRPSSLATV